MTFLPAKDYFNRANSRISFSKRWKTLEKSQLHVLNYLNITRAVKDAHLNE